MLIGRYRSSLLWRPGEELLLTDEGSGRPAVPDHKRPPPVLSPELVERLADIVVERVMAIIGVHPLHGGDQGFESLQLHHLCLLAEICSCDATAMRKPAVHSQDAPQTW